MYEPIPARLATVTHQVRNYFATWDGPRDSVHNLHQASRADTEPIAADSEVEPRIETGWDGACDTCGQPIPWDDDTLRSSAGVLRVYDTPSGKLEPGCLYWVDDYRGRCSARWTNCDGRHLHGVLPNGHRWDIDSRASNCGSPDDTEHRCWVRHGEPPNVHVDKNGLTCTAGAGSILAGDYHGFLHAAIFTAG